MITDKNDRKTILIVEDDPDMSELISAVLTEAGYKTISVPTGEQGIEKAATIRPDLVLLDVMLPKMNGIDACRSIASGEDTKGIPIIMVTIKRELSTKLASYIAGARRFITKPFGVEELLDEVRKTLRQTRIARMPEETFLDPRD